MWGFVADSTAAHLCRGYDAALGHFPAACEVNSGTPALAMTAVALLVVFFAARMMLHRLHPEH